jgi:hypothetical protein
VALQVSKCSYHIALILRRIRVNARSSVDDILARPQLAVDFLESEAKVSGSSQAMMAFELYSDDSGYSQRMPKQITGVHLAAYFGLVEATMALFKEWT